MTGSYRTVVYLLIAVNIAFYLAEGIRGGTNRTDVVRSLGGMYTPDVRRGQWYRLVTSMFLHYGFWHIFCNMTSLYYLGPSLAAVLGPGRFLAVYFIAGIAGNLTTYAAELRSHSYAVSAGASGAVFGLLGAWLTLAFVPELRGIINLRSLIYTIGINIVYGFINRGINMKAHLGGLAAGFICTGIMILF